jgi:hypothetical protein
MKMKLLSFSYYVDTALKTSIADAEVILLKMPSASKTEKGEILIQWEEHRCCAAIGLSSNKVSITFYLEKATYGDKAYALFKFLALLTNLKEVYEIKMGPICEPLKEALASGLVIKKLWYEPKSMEDRRVEALSASNSILAIELRKLNAFKETMERDVMIYTQFCKEVIGQFSKNSKDSSDASTALSTLGIPVALTITVLKLVDKGGGGVK